MKESSIVTNIWWPKRIKNRVFLPGINLYSVVQVLLKFRQSNDITIVSKVYSFFVFEVTFSQFDIRNTHVSHLQHFGDCFGVLNTNHYNHPNLLVRLFVKLFLLMKF